MLIVSIEALDVGNGIVGTEASQCVDVRIGVVACQIAVVEPEDALGVERGEQSLFNLLLGEGLVAVGRQEALAGGEDGAAAVALDAATLQDEVEVVLVSTLKNGLFIHVAADFVVERCLELLPPSVELEVEQRGFFAIEKGYETVVASPGVVGGHGM